MASNYEPTTVGPGLSSIEQLNNEFQKIKTAMDRLVSRYADAPNAMQFPLDLGGQDIINVGKITAVDLEVGGIDLAEQVEAAEGFATSAEDSAQAAQGFANVAQSALDNIRYAQVETREEDFTISTGETTKVLMVDSSSPVVVTLSSGADQGTQVVVVQLGSGGVTFEVESGDLISFEDLDTLAGQGAACSVVKVSNGWYLGGNLA